MEAEAVTGSKDDESSFDPVVFSGSGLCPGDACCTGGTGKDPEAEL